MIVGPSGCGKTVFTTKLLLDHPDLFETPPERKARWVPAHETAGRAFSRRHSRFGTLTRVVSQEERRCVGLGRSHGGRRQRQAGARSLHQTFSSSEHHGPLLVPRHLPARQIRQEHLPQRPLHCEFQKPARSIGHAQSPPPSLSHPMARRTSHLSKSHGTPLWLSPIGSPSQEQRRPTHFESPAKRRGLHAMPSVQARCCAVKSLGFRGFYACVNVT